MDSKLKKKLSGIISMAGGYLPIDVALQLAVQHYYSDANCIGSDGDFITAPEMSSAFAYCISRMEIFNRLAAEGRPFDILELGPGLGTLFFHLWSFLDPAVKNNVGRIIFLEISEKMREAQRGAIDRLKISKEKLIHVSSVEEAVQAVGDNNFFIVGNEFFDALPIKQYVKKGGALHEVGVVLQDDAAEEPGQSMRIGISSPGMLSIANNEELSDMEDGDIIEVSPAREYALKNLLELFSSAEEGCILAIDYGYFEKPMKNTIQSVRKHKKVSDFIKYLGEADISSLVDFNHLENCANEYISVSGQRLKIYKGTQREFLIDLGIEEVIKSGENFVNTAMIDRLVSEMGELFKVILISS